MKIGKFINRIKTEYSKGMPNESTRLSSRYIYSILLTIRASLYYNHLNKNIIVNEDFEYTSVSNIPIIKVTSDDILGFDDCNIKKSKYKIPKVLSSSISNKINITSDNGVIIYNNIKFNKIKSIVGGKYTSKNKFYFIRNDYLYVINSNSDKLTIAAPFFDPIQAYELQKLCNSALDKCLPYKEIDLKMSDDLADAVIKQTIKEIFETFARLGREDITSDNKDNALNETK